MTPRLFYWALTSALAGFLFGFDTVVISGAEQTIQKLWNLDNATHGLAIGSALWGMVLGSLVGGWPADRFGRKATLMAVGVLFFVSSVWSALAPDVYQLMTARFIGGIAVGVSTVAAPLYISEIAPPKSRGWMTGMFQFNIVFGILMAFASNWLVKQVVTADAWRWMLGVMAAPSLLYMVMAVGLPESPRWLLRRGDRGRGMDTLRRINPTMTEGELETLAAEIEFSSRAETGGGLRGFFTKRLKVPILLAVLVAFFNQLSGINAILYFAPRIFSLAGIEDGVAVSVGIGVVNLIFTFVGLWLIDRLGRRTLLYIGSFGYIASLGLCAVVFFAYAPQFKVASSAIEVKSAAKGVNEAIELNRPAAESKLTDAEKALEVASRAPNSGVEPVTFDTRETSDDMAPTPDDATTTADAALKQASAAVGPGGLLVIVCILAFIAAHAVGQGAVIWVFISEIFPNQYRATGQALGSFTHWIFAALLATFFPAMISAFAPGVVFAFFAFMMVLQLVWVATMVPETKGVPLEQIEQKLGVR
jgi:SP family arabinose:H+ symporter-like MFS transporter